MPSDPAKRERARLAQERSRARRKADLDRAQAQVQSLSNSIDEMTRIFLQFSEAMLADRGGGSSSSSGSRRAAEIGEYMRRFVAVARPAAELANADEGWREPEESSGSTVGSSPVRMSSEPIGEVAGPFEEHGRAGGGHHQRRPFSLAELESQMEAIIPSSAQSASPTPQRPLSPRMDYGLWVDSTDEFGTPLFRRQGAGDRRQHDSIDRMHF